MDYAELQEIATKHGLGQVHFQYNIAVNTGREFEVGYIFQNKKRVLFAKRGHNTSPDAFYLCNEFSELSDKDQECRGL
jgi:hypothetical protein